MTLRRKIAGWLRRAASRIDDGSAAMPRLTRPEIDAKVQAIFAIPRRPNRYVAAASFQNAHMGVSVLDDPLVLRFASDFERDAPGTYAENPDMVAAIARYRAGGGR